MPFCVPACKKLYNYGNCNPNHLRMRTNFRGTYKKNYSFNISIICDMYRLSQDTKIVSKKIKSLLSK